MDNNFKSLVSTIDETINKCEWIKSQSCMDIINSVDEERIEVSEAIKNEDRDNLEEEIGDLLFTVILLGRLCENEYGISLSNSIGRINQKIINRSPHVFGDKIASTPEEASKIWNSIKKKEYI